MWWRRSSASAAARRNGVRGLGRDTCGSRRPGPCSPPDCSGRAASRHPSVHPPQRDRPGPRTASARASRCRSVRPPLRLSVVPAERVESGPLLGRHVIGRAAEPLGTAFAGQQGLPGQVKIKQQRLTIGGKQHVGWLQIEMNEAALVGVLKPVRQGSPRSSTPPARRKPGPAAGEPAPRSRRSIRHDRPGPRPGPGHRAAVGRCVAPEGSAGVVSGRAPGSGPGRACGRAGLRSG